MTDMCFPCANGFDECGKRRTGGVATALSIRTAEAQAAGGARTQEDADQDERYGGEKLLKSFVESHQPRLIQAICAQSS